MNQETRHGTSPSDWRTRKSGKICSCVRFILHAFSFLIETHSLPALARCYPRSFTFYVAYPIHSIPPSTSAACPTPDPPSADPTEIRFVLIAESTSQSRLLVQHDE